MRISGRIFHFSEYPLNITRFVKFSYHFLARKQHILCIGKASVLLLLWLSDLPQASILARNSKTQKYSQTKRT